MEYEGEDLNEDYDTYSYDDYDAYNKGKLKYNGEYLYGLRNGKGKEYYDNIGKLRFEGEYLNGKRWNGKIYKYYDNGKIGI